MEELIELMKVQNILIKALFAVMISDMSEEEQLFITEAVKQEMSRINDTA